MQMFMYVPLAANVTQTTEGAVGTSIQVSVLTTTATIGRLICRLKKFAISVELCYNAIMADNTEVRPTLFNNPRKDG